MASDPFDSPLDKLLRTVLRSGVLDRDALQTALRRAPVAARQSPEAFARHLVEADLLTGYQSNKLLQGLWQGLTLNNYRVLTPLGRGGMGTVYLARDHAPEPPRLVALKVLSPKKAREEVRSLARFLREMEMSRRASHPNLTQTFDAGEVQGVYYIAMEFIRGVNLHQLVEASGPLSVGKAARLFADTCEGLAAAHAAGLIHRDMKPSNLMVTPEGHPKILDLGLAMVAGEDLPSDKSIVGGEGYIVGTMDYIAPEQAEDSSQATPRSDVYALGGALYFALTGQPPFPGGTRMQKVMRHRGERPTPITDLNPLVPIDFELVVNKMMSKNPANRPADAAAVRALLLPWADAPPRTPLPGSPDAGASAVGEIEEEHSRDAFAWDSIPAVPIAAAQQTAAEHAAQPAPVPPAAPTPPAEPRSSKGLSIRDALAAAPPPPPSQPATRKMTGVGTEAYRAITTPVAPPTPPSATPRQPPVALLVAALVLVAVVVGSFLVALLAGG